MSVCGSTNTTSGEPCQQPVAGPNETCWREGHTPGPGRPTKYDPAYCEDVVEMGRKGKSRAVMARELDVAMSTMQDWEERHLEFRAATTRARGLARAWWEEQGRSGIWASGEFNASAYRLQMQNRFPRYWRDRKSVEHSGPEGGPIEVERPMSKRQKAEAINDLLEQARAREGAISGNGAEP